MSRKTNTSPRQRAPKVGKKSLAGKKFDFLEKSKRIFSKKKNNKF